MSKPETIKNRIDVVLLFDVHDGNPNGDPDADNAPRIDPLTQHGLVSDVCLKRKLRNFVTASHAGTSPNAIFVTDGAVLADKKRDAYAAVGESLENGDGKKKVKRSGEGVEKVRQYMCDNYWDVRTFGGVMNTNVPAGTVRGPVQITFARSVSPIDPSLWTITRMAVETTEESDKQGGDNRTMGRKYTVPYGLYRAHLFITPGDAAKTGFSVADLALLKQGLKMMFDSDRSSGRGLMTMRAVYAFQHNNALGQEQAGRLFDRIKIAAAAKVPMNYADYSVTVDEAGLPNGILLEHWV